MKRIVLMQVVTALILAAAITADVPQMINYQGRLTDDTGTPVADGPYLIKFKIYGSAAGDDSLWYSGYQSVTVTDGLFTYQLGTSPSFPHDLFEGDTTRYLGITVGVDPEISPRTRVLSVAYAYQALRADSAQYAAEATSVPPGSIGATEVSSSEVQLRVDGTCAPGYYISQVNEDGSVVCVKDSVGGGGVTDHGELSGLLDDDHPQYLNTTIDDTVFSNITFGDSTMKVSDNRVQIGSSIGSWDMSLLTVMHDYDTTMDVEGVEIVAFQRGSGDIVGLKSNAQYRGTAQLDVDVYAIRASASGNNKSTGRLVGVRSGCSYGYDGYAFEANVSQLQNDGIGLKAYVHDVPGDAIGVYGWAEWAYTGDAIGIYGRASDGGNNTYAGYFSGDVEVTGTISKSGASIKIDHPLDPAGKYLQHSIVESPDMMNVYNGNVTLDANGEATVDMPEYFEALNMNFRYQLTPIGAPGPNLYIAREMSGNSFEISGGEPGMKVSWQVTGIRHDKWAEANRIQIEVEKKPYERGLYRHPDLYGFGLDKHVDHHLLKRELEEAADTHGE